MSKKFNGSISLILIISFFLLFFINNIYGEENINSKNNSQGLKKTIESFKNPSFNNSILIFPDFFKDKNITKIKKTRAFYFKNITIGMLFGTLFGVLGSLSILNTNDISNFGIIAGSFIGGGALLGTMGGVLVSLFEKEPYQYNLIAKELSLYTWTGVIVGAGLGALGGLALKQLGVSSNFGSGVNDIVLNATGFGSLIGLTIGIIVYGLLGKHATQRKPKTNISFYSQPGVFGINIRRSL